jgi:hypothetical protein
VHAAGFFTPRGMKLFGWGFIVSSAGLTSAMAMFGGTYPVIYGHTIMGVFFGGFHLAYGVYLHFTEQRKNEA